jgi:hypothetical protein
MSSSSVNNELPLAGTKAVVFAAGIDSFQALVLALQTIGVETYSSDYHKAGSLRWFEQYRGYGFAVGTCLRDILIGDDLNL